MNPQLTILALARGADVTLLAVIMIGLLAMVVPIALFEARRSRRYAEALAEPPAVALPDVTAMLEDDEAAGRAREHVTMVGYKQGRPPMGRSDPGVAPELFVIRRDGGSQTLRDWGGDDELRQLGERLAQRLGVEFAQM